MLDMEMDEQGQGQLSVEPCFLLGNVAQYPHPSTYPMLLSSGSTSNHYLCQLPDQNVCNALYGVPFTGFQPHHLVVNSDLGTSYSYSNSYMIPPPGSRVCPLPSNHGSYNQLPSSSPRLVVGTNEYDSNNHLMDGDRFSNMRKNAEGFPSSHHHFNSSSSLGIARNAGLLQSAAQLERGPVMLDAAAFIPPACRANDIVPVAEGSWSSSGTLGIRSGSTPHNQGYLVQGCYMGQSFQPTSNAWVEQHLENRCTDAGTSTWNHPGLPVSYLQERGVNEGPPEIMNMVQGYSDSMNMRSPTILSHPIMHQHFHRSAPPPMQAMHGHSYNFHHPASIPSYRHPTNAAIYHDTLNLSVDIGEMGRRYPGPGPGPIQSNSLRTSRPYETGARHNNRSHLRILPEDEVAILEFPGFYEVGNFNDPHHDMRLDIDDMSYEELLALGGQIGNVKARLPEESILSHLKMRVHCSATTPDMNQETCTVCQDEYEDQDKVGILDCGHEYHVSCINQWLQVKNVCPVCKKPAFTHEDVNGQT